jgi:tetratricopeptide (TPR) repeat protein
MDPSPTPYRPVADSDRPALAEIEAAVAAGDQDRSARVALAAFPHGVDHPVVLALLAHRDEQAGRYAEALAQLRRAAVLAPGDGRILDDMGHCLYQLGQVQAAIAAFDGALERLPDDLGALCNKAASLVAAGDRTGGVRLYERAAAAHPGEPLPLATLAALAARFGDAEAARAYAARALAVDPRHPLAALALVEADLSERAFAAAEARLRKLLGEPALTAPDRARCQSLLGDALDGQDRPAEAFAAYQAANDAAPRPPQRGEPPADLVARLNRYFDTAAPPLWGSSPGPDLLGAHAVRRHVFLVGFPRSGTTLLEQALASHPDVVSLEETSVLAEPSAAWLADDRAVARLARISGEDANRSRETYWRAVRERIDLGAGDKVLIDKAPLHTLRLPLIAKLFPDAVILFARRDPRDVVFSCFRRRISMSSTLDAFSTPERAAAYYNGVMRLAEIYLRLLPLKVAFVRHEDLVADFQEQATQVLNHLGLDWDPAVMSFAARARARSNTPSASQVARGLNAEGVGQWRRFAAQLAPVLPQLEPWVRRFGYEPSLATAPPAPAAAPTPAPPEEALEAVQRLVDGGRWSQAFDAAEAALDQGLEAPLFYKLRALKREQQGRPELAIADFERVLAGAPADFATLNALGLCLAKVRRLPEAMARLDAALQIQPAYAPAHYNRGWALENAGDLVAARAAYERVLELDPRHAQAAANLAALAVRASDWDRARRFAGLTLTLDPGHPTAAIALAQVDLAGGALPEAERRLRTLLADPRRPTAYDRSVALTTLGDALDRLDRTDEAFAAYEQANAGLRALNAARFDAPGVESGHARVLRLIDEFGATAAAEWRRGPGAAGARGPASGHVFLVGFPRSGTTLLGQVLQSHPDVVTLDEHETLVDASQAFLAAPGGLARLAAADDAALATYRDAYWRRVRAAGGDPDGKVFVDKLPMNSLGLPLIARLFPAAKLIFLRRDPRDVVLSAFRRQFVLNSATWELLTLTGAARFYDAVMRLSGLYLDRLEFDIREQSYEALVADFDGESRALAAFLGLDWSRAKADFGADARGGRIATPSAAQIARGLYAEGVGQWRRFEALLAPAMPLLQPWVDAAR